MDTRARLIIPALVAATAAAVAATAAAAVTVASAATAITPRADGCVVFDAATGTLVASRSITRARVVTFWLAPGRYRVSGRAPHGAQIFARPFTIRAGYTTPRYVIEPVP